ncbi:hypothetical protein niasHT_007011 [Heterodera trifolii]|uniref:Cytochrome b5 heme-binding domain-containing protein n=1 Tax=Heterodera trifolii TaxID=157864 RepID=A0ABD2LXC8_9BILA
MCHFHFYQIFIVFSLNFLRIKSKENEEPIGPPIRSSPSEVIVHLRANSYNISAFVPNHPGGEAVLRLVNGQDIEQYIEGRKCVLGICHRHRYAYQVLRQFEMPSDVIVGVKGKFYNISAFVPDHPGGPFVLKAINGQQNVEQYLEGRKCVFGICHRHANAYEVLSQLEMSGLNTAAAAPSTVFPSTAVPPTVFPHTVIASSLSSFPSLGHFQNSSTSLLIVPHFPGTKVKAQQRQLAQSLVKQSDKTNENEKEETNEGKRNNRTELAFANDLPTQNETKTDKVLKEEQIGKEMKGKAPKRKNNETATEEKQRDGKGKRNGGKERTEAKEKGTNSKKGNKKGTKSERKAKGEEEKRRKKAKSEQKKEKEVKSTDNQPENGQMPRAADARKRRVPLCLFVRRAEESPHNYELEGRGRKKTKWKRKWKRKKKGTKAGKEAKLKQQKEEEERKKREKKAEEEEEEGRRKRRKGKKKEEEGEKEGRRRKRHCPLFWHRFFFSALSYAFSCSSNGILRSSFRFSSSDSNCPSPFSVVSLAPKCAKKRNKNKAKRMEAKRITLKQQLVELIN